MWSEPDGVVTVLIFIEKTTKWYTCNCQLKLSEKPHDYWHY